MFIARLHLGEIEYWTLEGNLLKAVLATALGPHCSLLRLRIPNPTFGKLHTGKISNTNSFFQS